MKKKQKEMMKKWSMRPYSWSQHNSWDWSKTQWFDTYILNERGDASHAMIFGNVVGASIDTDAPLSAVPRQSHMEYEVRAKLGDIELLGFFDSYDPVSKKMEEYKTSSNDTKWTQDAVEKHGQLTYYCMLLYLRDKVDPEDVSIRLHYIPVGENQSFYMEVIGKHVTYETRRTKKDVFEMMVEITKRRKLMEIYAKERIKSMG